MSPIGPKDLRTRTKGQQTENGQCVDGGERPAASYWRSLEDLSRTPGNEALRAMLADAIAIPPDPNLNRRRFLAVMAASLSAAGVGCGRFEDRGTIAGSAALADRSAMLRDVRNHLASPAATRPRREGEESCPARQIDGPLVYSMTDRLREDEAAFFKEKFGANHRAAAEGLLNHCDGTTPPLDIALLLSLDAGAVVDVDDVRRGIELLRKTGYVA